MRRAKHHIPMYEQTDADKPPRSDGTDLTDEQRSKLFNGDERDATTCGRLSDPAGARGKEIKLRDLGSSSNLIISADRPKEEPNNLSPAAAIFKPEGSTNTAAGISIWPSSMATDPKNKPHTPERSTHQSQIYGETPSKIEAVAPGRQGPIHINHNISHIPPHLRGLEMNSQSSPPPNLRTSSQNNQYSHSLQPRMCTEVSNAPHDLGSLETPQQTTASAAVAIWRISPDIQAKQLQDSPTYAASIEANEFLPSVEKGIIGYERMAPVQSPSTISVSQEVAFELSFSQKTGVESKQNLDVAQKDRAPPTSHTILPPLSPISPCTMQTPSSQPADHKSRQLQFSVENTANFLAFLQKKEKEKENHGSWKKYAASGRIPLHADRESSFKQDGYFQSSTQITQPGNIQVNTTAQSLTHSPNEITAPAKNDIEVQTYMPVGEVDTFNGQGGFSVSRAEHVNLHSSPTARNVDPEAPSADHVNAPRDNGKPNNVTLKASHGWEDTRLISAGDIKKALLSEIMAYNPPKPGAPRTTAESLVSKSGLVSQRSEDSFCDGVSDTGVETRKENVRATHGRVNNDDIPAWEISGHQFRLDWEYERLTADLSYLPEYISVDWLPFVPRGPVVAVDTSTEEFRQGKLPVYDTVLGEEIIQPDCIPDTSNSENEQKRLRQTAEMDCIVFTRKRKKRHRQTEMFAAESEARHKEIAALELAPHPYAPAIPIYLRPVLPKDVAGMRAIYNYYSKNSIIPEDQDEILEEDIMGIIQLCQREKMPCVVAIKGTVPALQTQRHYEKSSKSLLPQFETVVGFGFAQTYGYGIGGIREGRSRTTAELQFYVHHEYTRKGIGRSLLDRLIQSMSHSYAAKDGYDWINPKDDPVYNSGSLRLWHKLVIQLPVEVRDDTDLSWFTEFLTRYWFDQEARLKNFARSSVHGSQARFLDVVVFSKTSSIEMEHPPFL